MDRIKFLRARVSLCQRYLVEGGDGDLARTYLWMKWRDEIELAGLVEEHDEAPAPGRYCGSYSRHKLETLLRRCRLPSIAGLWLSSQRAPSCRQIQKCLARRREGSLRRQILAPFSARQTVLGRIAFGHGAASPLLLGRRGALAKFTAGDSALDRLYQFGRTEGLMEQLQAVIGGERHALVTARNHHDRELHNLGEKG